MQIQRKILKSEPSFATILEDQIKFCKVWGGGKSQNLTKEVCDWIKLSNSTAMIPGVVFKKLAQLKLPPHALPSFFVVAFLKAYARGNLASKHADMIASSKENECRDADMYLSKSRQLTSDPVVLGNFDCDIVEFVFGVGENFEKLDSIQDIVQPFVVKVSGKPQHEVSQTQSTDGDGDQLGQGIFDARSDSAMLTLLKQQDLVVGALVTPKVHPSNVIDAQFEVTHISPDGSIGAPPCPFCSWSILKACNSVAHSPTTFETDWVAKVGGSSCLGTRRPTLTSLIGLHGSSSTHLSQLGPGIRMPCALVCHRV